MFSFRGSVGVVDVAFTDATLELDQVGEAFGGPVAGMRQVHGNDVAVVDSADGLPTADALVTSAGGLTLMVRVADCVPVVLADPDARVVGVAHAGRKGMASGVVPAAVRAMRDLGAGELRAWIGPHICGRCYEVPARMRDEVSALVPEAWSQTSWATPSLALGRGVVAQLAAEGVPADVVGLCTREDRRLHSYRRDGDAAGRFAGLVRIGV